MALKKQTEIMGFQTNAYAKVASVKVRGYIDKSGTKKYEISALFNFYTDDTKKHLVRQIEQTASGYDEENLNFNTYYNVGKADYFSDWEDC